MKKPKRVYPSSILDPSEGIRLDRTYRTRDLTAFISSEVIGHLARCYGLLQLGGREYIYFGQNVIESLIRYAKNERVEPIGRQVTVSQLRAERRARGKRGAA